MSDMTYTTYEATVEDMIRWLQKFPPGTSLTPGKIELGRPVGKIKDAVLKEYKVEFTFTAFEEVKPNGRK